MIDDLLVLHVKHPRYGYRRITIKLREKGWFINFKRVYRLWCQEGLKIRKKQRKKLHIGCSENACNRKRPEYYNHIWSYDLLSERLENGRLVKLLVVIDEFTRKCLAIDVNKSIKGEDVVEVLRYLFAVRGEPDHIRSDNGPEFANKAVKTWLEHSGVKTLFVAPGSPWENGYVESFNSKLRDELLNRELFLHIDKLRYVGDRWRMDYNHYRPHRSLDYMDPTAFAVKYLEQGSLRSILLKTRSIIVKYSHDRWINDMGQVNIIPYLNNKTGDPHKALYWRFWDQSAIRMGNWKFLKAGSREFLFNVEADDHETKNLITKKLSLLIVSMINARQTCLRIIK